MTGLCTKSKLFHLRHQLYQRNNNIRKFTASSTTYFVGYCCLFVATSIFVIPVNSIATASEDLPHRHYKNNNLSADDKYSSKTNQKAPSIFLNTKMAPNNNNNNNNDVATSTATSENNDACSDPYLPTMIVFDLDDCLWTPEMHELYSKPTIPVKGILNEHQLSTKELRGVVGLKNHHGDTVRLYDGARQTLYELATNPKYRNIIIAVASSSLEPSYSYACLEGIEILPGHTMKDMITYHQIGRSGKLSPRKTTHFRELHKESGIPYEEMLFFDDCNWGDHCADVSQTFGVVSQRTPNGLQYSEFQMALEKYKQLEKESSETVQNMVR